MSMKSGDQQVNSDPGGSARGRAGLALPALLLGVAALAVVLAVQLAERNRGRPLSGPAPDFALRLFEGGDFQLSDYRGDVALVNFWASWCPPCRDEAPDLQALHVDYAAQGFKLLGVNMLESSVQKARDFLAEFGVTYANGEDTGQYVTNLYRVEGPPESFLIDRRGHVRKVYIGSVSYDRLSGEIEALLAEAA